MIRIKFFSVLLFSIITIAACNKDKESEENTNNCVTVAFPDGPAYIKVVNDYPQAVIVFLHLGNLGNLYSKEIESGHCEIFGVQATSNDVEIKTLDLSKSRIVATSPQDGQTITVVVDPNFF
ncbi:MAG: hypothetical protein ACKVU0_02220 [Saprospiraceae bacterium]